MARTVSALVHGCDMGFLGVTPGGLHPPLLTLGYERAYSEGYWGNPSLDSYIEFWSQFPGFRGVKFSWSSGTWSNEEARTVGWYPINSSAIRCNPRTPLDTPRKAIEAGFVPAHQKRAKVLASKRLITSWYTALPPAQNLTPDQIDAYYAIARDIGVDQIDLDTLGACSTVNPSGHGSSAAWRVRERLLATFRMVTGEPVDVVTPGLIGLYDGKMGLSVAGWGVRMTGPGWANLFCTRIARFYDVILPGSIPIAARLNQAVTAARFGALVTIELFDVPRPVQAQLLTWSADPQQPAPNFEISAPAADSGPSLGHRLSGGVPWGRGFGPSPL